MATSLSAPTAARKATRVAKAARVKERARVTEKARAMAREIRTKAMARATKGIAIATRATTTTRAIVKATIKED